MHSSRFAALRLRRVWEAMAARARRRRPQQILLVSSAVSHFAGGPSVCERTAAVFAHVLTC